MNVVANAGVSEAFVKAVIIRRDGTREDLGTIAYWNRNPLRRALWWVKQHKLLVALMLTVLVLSCCGELAPAFGLAMATVFTNAGKAITTNRMTGAGTEAKWVAWGTGAGTAGVTDTTLFTESAEEARTVGTSSRPTTTVANDTYQVTGTITVATSNKTITNVGLFDALTVGNLYMKADFTGIALVVGEAIAFSLSVKYA